MDGDRGVGGSDFFARLEGWGGFLVHGMCRGSHANDASPDGGNDCEDTKGACVQQELEEELLVAQSDAIVDPGAVVIHLENAPLAD